MIQPVILCGGSGTRLWPLSRKAFPKQFAKLVLGKSLLSLTIERLVPLLGESLDLICVGSEEHQFMLRDEVTRNVSASSVILEPCARNTTAAMAMAALQAPHPDQLQLFCPSDHHVPDIAAFGDMVRRAAPCAQDGAIVIFGVVPSHPSAAYGYIERGAARDDGGFAVARFLEKPSPQRASELIFGGNVLWNAGIFLSRADVLLAAIERHAPEILRSCREAMAGKRASESFVRPAQAPLMRCPAESIDVAVMERHVGLVVFPFAGSWSDVGSWNAVADMCPADSAGNFIDGAGVSIQGSNNYIYAPTRRVVALGTTNLIIVDTPDAVLVADRSAVEQVKSVVLELERRGDPEAVAHRKVLRPWGWYDTLERGPRFQVKRIVVNPGGVLSLQKHFHRAEHWTVVRGTAEVTRGADTFLLTENESTYIPIGEIHRLSNPGRTPVELIEVQSGEYLGEDDIVRLEDVYGRSDAAKATPAPRLEGAAAAIV
ncbi:MAG TPA: mannose-1-phosphate guanylyltransferase/mannose-6-phosphate isomerase [Ramlibacter sp.]|nr:mannose-1-phosphate guanylyltransferase/mannose-6-phosphate isomerase [Ramlibacter sp.]